MRSSDIFSRGMMWRSTYRHEGISIMTIVVDVQCGSVVQTHARRTLDLDQQGIQLILKMLAIKRTIKNLAAIVVRHQLAVAHPS
jgi:hypothetical protein